MEIIKCFLFSNDKRRKTNNGESCYWLVYDETSQTVFCSVCCQHTSDANKRTNSFNFGSNNLEIWSHERPKIFQMPYPDKKDGPRIWSCCSHNLSVTERECSNMFLNSLNIVPIKYTIKWMLQMLCHVLHAVMHCL